MDFNPAVKSKILHAPKKTSQLKLLPSPQEAIAKKIFEEGFLTASANEENLSDQELLYYFRKEQTFYQDQRNNILQLIKDCLAHSDTHGLIYSDLYRLNPTSLLKRLMKSNQTGFTTMLIGAYGVLFTLEQRASRCIKFHEMGPSGIVPLHRERENRPHSNWSPAEFPEWLIFEIESNISIRPMQINVAKQMIAPPGDVHSVMQLNMGEGKTAVIVPLLVLNLSNYEQICRITVLKSLFKTNMTSLMFSLGGLLNRRIYTFPCQRDFNITGDTGIKMMELYAECRCKRGAIMTIPEHRLSFQLKGYEKCRARLIEDATPLINQRTWVNENVRDVLDESDEILHAKYQLIYTLGSQLSVDGGAQRWEVAQSVLKILQARMLDLQKQFGDSFVDVSSWDETKPEIFHHMRLLKKECYQKLIELVASDILDRKSPKIKLPELLQEKENF
ncbi:hypothetical protein Fcan01_20247 [Folsomia candida]|uniref:ubiquitinyl hydrolase 1 n=1 Tax=Folsomia candida TaxID=158441 RepID=A0A226DJN0_FOLCA|nr:hypothetical protein Fcan01_20247 [Folsomia candida]